MTLLFSPKKILIRIKVDTITSQQVFVFFKCFKIKYRAFNLTLTAIEMKLFK